METVCPTVVGSLVRIWSVLHADVPVRFIKAEVRLVRHALFHMHDDLIAQLLVSKLGKARMIGEYPPDVVRIGSEVLYSLQGQVGRVRVVHGSTSDVHSAGVGTSLGAALIGFRAGQSLLWPLESGCLAELKILDVRRASQGRALPELIRRKQSICASG